MTLRHRPTDWIFVLAFGFFAFTSLIVEPYVAFGWALDSATDPIGRAWAWYAHTIDPMFLATPTAVRVMFGLDAFVFGPFYVVLLFAFVRGRDWIRLPALLYVSAMLYSMAVDLALQLMSDDPRRNLAVILLFRCPYVAMPLALAWRLRHTAPFDRN